MFPRPPEPTVQAPQGDPNSDQGGVRLRGVHKTFDGAAKSMAVTALEGIDLAIAAGEFVSLIGPSGCGKSTLLRLVADLIQPTSGTITVNGKTPRLAREDRDYGMVFQSPVLFDWRTVEANVALPLQVVGVERAERDRRVGAMVELVELADFRRHLPWQLSGGMQQRVSIARALVLDPRLLLMDEPFGALDEMTRERMNLELRQIWSRTRTTVIFVTHSIPEAVFLSTRVVVMSARPGRIAASIDIDLPNERTVDTRELARYFELVTEVRESLRGRDGRAPLAVDRQRVQSEGLS
jgi:NitT/TauT family transport system ATP-binding protein